MKIFLPEDIAEDYKYLVFEDNHVDIYSEPTLEQNNTYTFYRSYYLYNRDLFQEYSVTPTSSVNLDCVEVETTHDILYRSDFSDICLTVFILVIAHIFLINIVTSIFRRGGALGGLI